MTPCRTHFPASLTVMLLFAFTARAEDKVTYQDNILPIIQANCAKCHNEDKKKADLDLTSYQGALKGSGSGVVLISGNPDASKLWKSITQTEEPFMPQNQPPLPNRELETFKKWIQGGLLENAGGKAVAASKPRMDSPGRGGRVQGSQPIETNPCACSGLYGTRLSRMYCQTCADVHAARGLSFTSAPDAPEKVRSRSTTSMAARVAGL